MVSFAAALTLAVLSLPPGEKVRTDCFRGLSGALPQHVAWAEVTRGEKDLVIWVGRRTAPGEKLKASGCADRPETMFSGGGETVELALVPGTADDLPYYHFIANPSNVLYRARRRDAAWRPDVPVTSRPLIEEDRWGVAFVVPYAALGALPPADGECWRANFAVGCDNWAGVGDYHQPRQFGILAFGTTRPRAHVESISSEADGTLHVSFAVSPRKRTGEIPPKAPGDVRRLSLAEGEGELASVDVRLPDDPTSAFSLDRYYYPAGEELRLKYQASGFRKTDLRIRRLDADDILLASSGRPSEGVLKVPALPAGEYAFEMSDGEAFAACPFEVCAPVRVSDTRSPHYPVLGSQKVPSAFLSVGPALKQRFTRVPTTGYVYDPALPLYGAHELLGNAAPDGRLYRLAYEAQMAVMLGKNGEVTFAEDRPSFYAKAYAELKRAYPNHRFSIHVDSPSRARDFARACDVFEYAAPGCSYAADLLPNLRTAVDELKSLADGRPALMWLGAAFPENGRRRTAEELNAAIRYCVLKGLAGNILHMGHGGVPRSNTRLWSFLEGCEASVNAWYPIWARGSERRLDAEEMPDIACGLRDDGTRTVLIAVNFSRCGRTLRYVDPLSGAARTLHLTGFGSAVVVSSGREK